MQLKDAVRKSDYSWLPQPEILERLAEAGIKITSQTLRNWERNSLLIPPKRGGQRGGRKSDYCEFVLAEAFAVYRLTQAELSIDVSKTEMSLPKFSLSQLSVAREQIRRVKCWVPGYPIPPSDTAVGPHYYDEPFAMDASFKKNLPLPDFRTGNKGEILLDPSVHVGSCDGNTHLQYHFFQTLYIAWFRALSLGCDTFLAQYRR